MGLIEDRPAARIADEVEAQAYGAMFDAAPPPLRERLGLRVERLAGATLLLAPGLPTPLFNRAIGLGWAQEADLEAVDAARERYRAAGVPAWWLHWNPLAAPEGFAARLRQAGFTAAPRERWAKMLRGTQAPPAIATPMRVTRAEASQVPAVARMLAQCFEMPPFMAEWLARLDQGPWRLYAVSDGAQVVGGGCLYLHGTLGWLGVAGIAASHRGRGGHGALMALRIAEAARAGVRHLVTETGEPASPGEAHPSLANMRRCGFTQVASRLNLVPPAQAPRDRP